MRLTFVTKLGESSFLISVQRGLTLVLPLVLVGSLATMVRDIPFSAVRAFLDLVFGGRWMPFCDNLVRGTFGIASLAVLCSFGYSLASLYNQRNPGRHVSCGMSAAVVLSSFFLVTSPLDASNLVDFLSLNRGLLVALCLAAAAGQLFLYMAGLRWLRLPLTAAGQDPVVHDVLTTLPAGMAVLVMFGMARPLMEAGWGTDLALAVHDRLMGLFAGGGHGLCTALVYKGLSQLFWLIGAHGPNMLAPVEHGVFDPAALENMHAAAMGLGRPYIVTKPFLDAFTGLGGSGSTLCLIAAILLRGRDGGSRKICLFSLFPALFNVNEPLLFGLPLVFNPFYAIAFLATPLVQTVTAYAATSLDLVPRTMVTMSWTVPPFLSGYVATDSWAGTSLQMVNFLLGTAIYLPFVALADRVRERSYGQALRQLTETASGGEAGPDGNRCLDRPGAEGRLAKALANDLARALERDTQLFLEYQPQCSENGARIKVTGVEALLRWRHPTHGLIAPPVVVALAEETGMIDRLGLWVLQEACSQRAAWSVLAGDALTISVNMSPRQFRDPALADRIVSLVSEAGLTPDTLEIEITESVALLPDNRTLATLRTLRQTGVRVAIDDFGMGYASLRYLRQFPVDVIKIDRSLTMDSPGGVNAHIIRSIVSLSANIGCGIVVEGVETKEQLQRFRDMGCTVFQGYLFSRPVSGEKCLEFILKHQGA